MMADLVIETNPARKSPHTMNVRSKTAGLASMFMARTLRSREQRPLLPG